MNQKETLFQIFYDSSGICTDTRKIEQDCLFICIKGDNFDGNTFAEQALKSGAKHVIVDNPEYYNQELSMTLVDDSVGYLQQLANYHRKKFDIPVIGITGSNGKTTSKELINAVLSKKYNVLATTGNLNNHLGVPFTLLRMNEEHEIAIIEMGANNPGEIKDLSAIAEPNYGIITNIGKAHLEGFGGFEGVLNTKKALYESVVENSGKIIINKDDKVLTETLGNYPNIATYGTDESSDISGELTKLSPFVEMTWTTESYTSDNVETQLVGKYNFYNFLAAITFGIEFNVDYKDISDALREYTPSNNRSQVKRTTKNTLLLDCYNANPTSMASALESFALIEHDDKLAIVGDMKELGPDSKAEHQKILSLLKDLHIKAITVGIDFKNAIEDNTPNFETTEELQKHIEQNPINNMLVLLKGSRSIGLEKLEKEL